MSDTDSEEYDQQMDNGPSNDTDTDNSEDESPVIMFKKPVSTPSQNNNITTEGITMSEYKFNPSSVKLSQCEVCQKIYSVNSNGEPMVNSINGLNSCWHCLFWMNYDLTARSNVDGVYGKTIAEYIIDCRDSHDPINCSRVGACFLCDNLNGYPIDGIICGEMINNDNKYKDNDGDKDETIESEFAIEI